MNSTPIGTMLDSLRGQDERHAILVRDLLDAASAVCADAPGEGLDAEEAISAVNSVKWNDQIIALQAAIDAMARDAFWVSEQPKQSEVAEQRAEKAHDDWLRHLANCMQCSDPDLGLCVEGYDLYQIAKHWSDKVRDLKEAGQ